MKTLQIRPQPRLSLRQTVVTTLNGIRYRLFRSAVTVVVVTVAIAFMMNILGEGVVKRSVAQTTRARIARMRMVSQWSGRLSMVPSREQIILMLSAGKVGERDYRQLQRMAGLSDSAMAEAARLAGTAAPYLRFFDQLDIARRRVLLAGAEGTDVFARLSTESHMRRFVSGVDGMRTLRFPGSREAFSDFLQRQWPILRRYVDAMHAGWYAGVVAVKRHLDGDLIVHALRRADGSFGDVIRMAGFVLSDSTARALALQAGRASDRRRIEGALSHLAVRQFVAGRLDILPGQVNLRRFWHLIGSDEASAEAFLRTARADGVDLSGVDARRVLDLAHVRSVETHLERADRAGGDSGAGLLGMG
ncbi:MAG: hypothetical protein GF331_10855, partial [Chitinivibrionales bacterium]|nr:hypothetical protein [Chitinivibrionales bacterium]